MTTPQAVSGPLGLHAVLYASRATPAPNAHSPHQVNDILAISQRNNQRDAITGALLACDGWFLQTLEGRRLDVEQTLRRIEQDPAHTDIRRLYAGPIQKRAFPQWSMCAAILSPTDEQIVAVLSKSGKFHPETLDMTAGLRLLLSVSRLRTSA